MARRSAGLMMYRESARGLEVLLVHPGGPFWAKKDRGAWSIPKGEYDESESALEAAVREFREETGFAVSGTLQELGSVKQGGGKVVSAWAFRGDCDVSKLVSNSCRMEWPPRSGRQIEFPEIDRGGWFTFEEAGELLLKGQVPLLDALRRVAAGKDGVS